MSNRTSALKDLGALVASSVARYNAEFIWQDVKLTDEFKGNFAFVLSGSNADVSFFENTAIVTTSKNKQIFVPNQWFVIASYVVDLCRELKTYQSFFFKVADSMHKDYEDFAKELRSSNTSYLHHDDFLEKAREVLSDESSIPSQDIKLSSMYLWRFCTDYTWWAGQKTIDRGDFMNSTILSILNLVAASQGFVADIVLYYLGNDQLEELVRNPDDFTEDVEFNAYTPISQSVSGYVDQPEEEQKTLQDSGGIQYGKDAGTKISGQAHRIIIPKISIDKFRKK